MPDSNRIYRETAKSFFVGGAAGTVITYNRGFIADSLATMITFLIVLALVHFIEWMFSKTEPDDELEADPPQIAS